MVSFSRKRIKNILMKWKEYIENQHLTGRIPQEWKVKIIFTAEKNIKKIY